MIALIIPLMHLFTHSCTQRSTFIHRPSIPSIHRSIDPSIHPSIHGSIHPWHRIASYRVSYRIAYRIVSRITSYYIVSIHQSIASRHPHHIHARTHACLPVCMRQLLMPIMTTRTCKQVDASHTLTPYPVSNPTATLPNNTRLLLK